MGVVATKSDELVRTAELPDEQAEAAERIECIGKCHNGPIDDSPKALRYAADHDPEAPAAFLVICPNCDCQLPLCEKKVDALLEWAMLRSEYMRCNMCDTRVLTSEAEFIPLNK
jgi:hypothetical protein